MKTVAGLLTLLPLLASCATPIQSELDAEVKRRCAIDGGVKAFETVEVSPGSRDKYGNVKIPAKAYSRPQDEYYFESDSLYYRHGNPEMFRTEYRIVRARDKKVMGISIVYTRRGGDLPSPMHDSSYICPAIGSLPSLETLIFVGGR